MPDPAPKRQRVTTFPTPVVGDVLFYETVDAARVGISVPEYGSAHPDTTRWEHHKLVYIKATDSQNLFYQFWYAADRENQDLYNFESTIADIEGTKFDAVKRTYVFRRDAYDPEELQMGEEMPDLPVGRFIGSHVLAIRKQVRIGDAELDSIFITEVRTYMKRCSITMIQTEDFFGIGGSKVSNWYYRGDVVDGSAVEVHFATPNSAYWGWQSDGTQRDGQQISENWYIISIISSVVDAIDGYNFSYPVLSSIDIPKRLTDSIVIFNKSSSKGNMDQNSDGSATAPKGKNISSSIGLQDSCSSSVSITPELGLVFTEKSGSYIPGRVYAFFLPENPTMADIIARVSALHGSAVQLYTAPTTTSGLITLVSGSARVSASASASLSVSGNQVKTHSYQRETSVSTDKTISQTTQFVQINGVLGGGIPDKSDSAEIDVEAAMSVYVYGSLGNFSANAFIEDAVTVNASVTTGQFGSSVNGSSNGSFIVRISVEAYRFHRAKIFVEVVDLEDIYN